MKLGMVGETITNLMFAYDKMGGYKTNDIGKRGNKLIFFHSETETTHEWETVSLRGSNA